MMDHLISAWGEALNTGCFAVGMLALAPPFLVTGLPGAWRGYVYCQLCTFEGRPSDLVRRRAVGRHLRMHARELKAER